MLFFTGNFRKVFWEDVMFWYLVYILIRVLFTYVLRSNFNLIVILWIIMFLGLRVREEYVRNVVNNVIEFRNLYLNLVIYNFSVFFG